ncbi:MAG: hypothetical protein LBK69_00730, partial [Syntrophomonadaceae bacterium]|nr:hypothetical protein [Syntrophomonadaceae bacterium]
MEENILRIVFYKSNSGYFEPVKRIAEKFTNYVQDGRINEIKIPPTEIFEKIFYVEGLFQFICSWKHTEITFNDKKLFDTHIQNLSSAVKCAKKYNKSLDKDTYCYLHEDKKEGWHCKHLTNMPRHIPSSYYDYIRKCYHWFDFGNFEGDIWIINKNLIKQKLLEEVEEK